MSDTERDLWINDYAHRLVEDLAGRGIALPEEAAREAVENMVTEVSDTAGISERDARLTITPAAVGAWATRVAQGLADRTEWVTISGSNFAAAQYWVHASLTLIEQSTAGDTPIEQIHQAREIVARVGAMMLDTHRATALEFAVPEEAMQELVGVLEFFVEWLMAADAEQLFSVAADIPDFDDSVGDAGTWIEAMTYHARQIAGAISSTHRHVADPIYVLTYGDVDLGD